MADVLIIESDKVLARTYARALEHSGFEVVCAYAAQEALTAMDAQAPRIVILDMQLAGHDYLAFLHEFRSYVEWSDIPVVLLSALTDVEMQRVGPVLQRDFAVSASLYKPRATLQQLIRTVREHIKA